LEAQGEAGDAYSAADVALERLEKRVRRYKRRLKNHHHGISGYSRAGESSATDYVVRVDEEANETDDREEDAPLIVAESERVVREMTVSEAVMHLDLTEDAFLVFRNAGHGGINIVYRRTDGNIGWIDPQSGTSKGNSGVATLSKS
jgi:cellulase/cellobiase CelA1